MSNLDPNVSRELACDIRGALDTGAVGRVLTAGMMQAHNTVDAPHAVQPVEFVGSRISGSELTLSLPAKSVVSLEIGVNES